MSPPAPKGPSGKGPPRPPASEVPTAKPAAAKPASAKPATTKPPAGKPPAGKPPAGRPPTGKISVPPPVPAAAKVARTTGQNPPARADKPAAPDALKPPVETPAAPPVKRSVPAPEATTAKRPVPTPETAARPIAKAPERAEPVAPAYTRVPTGRPSPAAVPAIDVAPPVVPATSAEPPILPAPQAAPLAEPAPDAIPVPEPASSPRRSSSTRTAVRSSSRPATGGHPLLQSDAHLPPPEAAPAAAIPVQPSASVVAATGGIQIANISDGGFIFWLLRFYAFGLLSLIGLCVCAAFGTYVYFAATLPRIPELARYQSEVATTTVVRGWDGTPLAEFATERREILPFERIPAKLIQAFLAAEDRRFYEHGGIDYRGIARALGANLRAGEVSQGGSTITQQVAKSFLSSERTIQRKIREAILARRLEGRLSKNDILTLYLNQIFLGAGAYGVGGGARRYFDKSIDQLDLGEMATLAGLVRAPSRFSPLTNLEAGRARRDQVLSAMVASGYITDAEATTWKARPLAIRPRADFFRLNSPYFTEHVRRDLARRYGDKKLWEGGLQVDTTVVPWIDASAQENVDFGLRKLDKRQGWRGPVAHLAPGPAAVEFRRRSEERYGSEPPAEGRLYLGLVESVTDVSAQVRVGTGTYALPLAGLAWAVPYSLKDSTNGRSLKSTVGVLHAGDVVWVKNAHRSKLRRFSDFTYDEKSEVQWLPAYDEAKQGVKAPDPVELLLEQTPRVQGAIFSYDHSSGYVVAMIGGDDYDRSEFNRVTQACRQPGSSYKPMYYSLAMDRGYGFGSLLNDLPRAEVDPITGEVWTPTNLNNTVEYQVSLEYALIWSKNVPSVQLFKLMGGHDVEAWARRLGITTPIIPDQALALGASCSRMDEMTRAFSAFARNGVLVDPVSIRRVRDRSGRILEDNTWIGDPMGRPEDRLDQLVMVASKKPTPAISPRTAWLTSTLLRHVVTKGHAPAIRNASIMAAGKTGTSSATMDVWFVGYTSRWMTSAWVGDDLRQRPLGAKDAAFMITVPMFARYINEVTVGQPLKEIPWERPPTVKPGDTGGKVRTTLEEVVGDGKAPVGKTKPKPKIDEQPDPAPAAKPAPPVAPAKVAPAAKPAAPVAPAPRPARPAKPGARKNHR